MLKISLKQTTVAIMALVSIQTFCFPSFAQVKPLSIDDVVAAIPDNDVIKKAEAMVGAARAEVHVARAGHLPTAVAALGPEIVNGKYENAVSLTVTENIFTGHVVSNQIDAAKHLVNAAVLNIEYLRQQLISAIKINYYEIQKAILTKKAQQKAVDAAKKFELQAQAALKAGLAGSALDLANARAALASANTAVEQAQYQEDTNCDSILDLLQLDYSQNALCDNLVDTNPPVQPTLTEQEAEQVALATRPDLKQLGETISANAATVKTFNKISGFSVGVAVSDTRNSGSSGPGTAINDTTVSGTPNASGNDFRIGLSAQYKLDPARRGNRDNAEWIMRSNQIQLDSTQRSVKQAVQDAYANLKLANQLSVQANALFTNQKLVYTIAKEQVKGGLLISLLYVQVIANTAAAEAAANTALISIREAINQVQLAIGQVTAGNLVAAEDAPVDKNALP